MSDLTEIEKLDETIEDLKRKAAVSARRALFSAMVVVLWIILMSTGLAGLLTVEGDGLYSWLASILAGFLIWSGIYFAAISASGCLTAMLNHSEAVAERAALIRQSNDY